MAMLIEQWLINPESFRQLRLIRAEIRKETGKEIHFSDDSEMAYMLELGVQSKNPRIRFMSDAFKKQLEESDALH